ncbi:Uncharacterised protein [Mycobacterium tuberculosis]|nr:Uncharacterised protein [Mycobacterium tuberculosis]
MASTFREASCSAARAADCPPPSPAADSWDGSMTYTSRSGMSRFTASSTAHNAACVAALDPSIPTTTARAGRGSLIAVSFAGADTSRRFSGTLLAGTAISQGRWSPPEGR